MRQRRGIKPTRPESDSVASSHELEGGGGSDGGVHLRMSAGGLL